MKFFQALSSFRYLSLLQYLPFLEELRLSMVRLWGDWDLLASNVSDILFRAVDLATGGLAARVVDQERITTAVTDVSQAVISLMTAIADIQNGTERLEPRTHVRV